MSKNHYIIPIFISHQGCPHQCVFCNQNKIAGECNDDVTAKDVIDTVEEYLNTINSKGATIEISFFGGTFTAISEKKQRELLEVAYVYKKNKKIHNIRLSTRPDAINKYILTYLKEYTVDIIELGVQSLDDEVLKLSGRGHTAKDVEIASKLIKEFGIVLGHQIMPGLPGDNFEKDLYTVTESLKMKPDICRIYPALIVKETPMEELYNRKEYKPYTLNEAVEISSKILKMYKDAKTKVIRIGLQPTESITWGGDIIDGPFHPAFRELVEGFTIKSMLLEKVEAEKDVMININEKDLSKLYANKKQYFKEFLSQHTGKVFVKTSNKIKKGQIELIVIQKQEKFKI